jgi:thiol-disulfide isomerase/thioredoxin
VLADGQQQERSIDAFCEERAREPASAKRFALPELDGTVDDPGSSWAWYSLWATWCGPCLEEMPLMKGWEKKLAAEGLRAAIRHISVDASAEDLAAFVAEHPEVPSGPRLRAQEQLDPWLGALGLTQGGSIPIHIFVDPAQRVRCIRVGAVTSADYRTIKGILGSES